MSGVTHEAPTVGIGRLLQEGSQFEVPHHQRDYAWTEDEIEQLFSDVLAAMDENQSEYFVGLMVFMPKNDKEFYILDGQQRLATVTIILAAIRSWLKARGFDRDAEQIQREFIAVREYGEEEEEARLILNENNNPYFQQFVVKESPTSEVLSTLDGMRRYDTSRKLLQAILFCRDRIDSIAREAGNADEVKARKLFSIVQYFRDSVKIVRLTVSDEANAYTVFETLNDRGLALSVLDLVKNYMFGKASSGNRLRDLKNQWAQMLATLSDVPADDFLKVWWTSRYGRIQKTQLFPKFKQQIGTWESVRATMNDMLKAAEYYAALGLPDDPVWHRISLSLQGRERIGALKLLGAKQVHPVLLAAVERFSERELERLLRLLEVLIVRYQLIGGGRTGRLEILCASLAHKIWQREVTNAAQAFQEVRPLYLSDDEFREAFQYKQERNNQKASWILKKLEIQARQRQHNAITARELEPGRSLTLEHIFPRSPGHNWSTLLRADPAFAEECTYRLGNMCLLTGVNRALGNAGFEEKKEVYAQSDLLLTRRVAEFDTWNRETVDKRQREMARLAVALWRFDV